jgi:hypothetical protein
LRGESIATNASAGDHFFSITSPSRVVNHGQHFLPGERDRATRLLTAARRKAVATITNGTFLTDGRFNT